jgi:hypothetical protein
MTNLRHEADAARLSNSLPDAPVSTRPAPEFRIWWADRAAVVPQPRAAIERQAQWSVEIDDLGKLCDEQRRRDPKRRADRATDHDPQAPALRFLRQRERLGQPARLVELDIDGLVFPVEPVEISNRPAGFVSADRYRMFQPHQRVISVGRQRLLYQCNPQIDEYRHVFAKLRRIPALVGIDDEARRRRRLPHRPHPFDIAVAQKA